MPYKVTLTRSATKELDKLPNKSHSNVIDHLRQLERNPRLAGAEKLTSIDAYKLRVGNYRVIYQIDDREKHVRVTMVEDRKQVYKRIKRK